MSFHGSFGAQYSIFVINVTCFISEAEPTPPPPINIGNKKTPRFLPPPPPLGHASRGITDVPAIHYPKRF